MHPSIRGLQHQLRAQGMEEYWPHQAQRTCIWLEGLFDRNKFYLSAFGYTEVRVLRNTVEKSYITLICLSHCEYLFASTDMRGAAEGSEKEERVSGKWRQMMPGKDIREM